MVEIVERLRQGVLTGNPYDAEEVMDQAADEIERLRAISPPEPTERPAMFLPSAQICCASCKQPPKPDCDNPACAFRGTMNAARRVGEPTEEMFGGAVRAGCNEADMHLTCSYPGCKCKQMPAAIRAALRAIPPLPKPTDTNRAENILREFEELHGQITIDERKWLRDRIAAELSPPEPTEGQVEAAAERIYQVWIDDNGLHDEPSWSQLSEHDKAPNRRDARAALRAMPLQDHAKRWRHKKRGSTYIEIGRAKLQASDKGGFADYQPMVVYRSDADGSLWVRPADEFDDGRFELIAAMVAEDGISEVKS